MISSIILALHLAGLITAGKAAAFLMVMGILLLVSEFFFMSGLIAFSGLLALYVAYSLQYGQNMIFGYPVDWDIVMGVALVEALALAVLVVVILRYRRKRSITGTEGMIGQQATVIEWTGRKGRVRLQGELWMALSDSDLTVKADDTVQVIAVDNLTLKIKA